MWLCNAGVLQGFTANAGYLEVGEAAQVAQVELEAAVIDRVEAGERGVQPPVCHGRLWIPCGAGKQLTVRLPVNCTVRHRC